MAQLTPNHFEKAFENWLKDSQVQHVQVDQSKRAVFARSRVKGFDILIYPKRLGADVLIAEVKGRKYRGKGVENIGALPSWVTIDDVQGLEKWEEMFGKGYSGIFVFVYELARVDVDTGGKEVFQSDNRRYFALGVRLADYRKHMKMRSPRWQTVTLSAADLRSCAVDLRTLLF